MNSNEDYTINVKTFGGFSIRYKDSELSFGNQSESQMVQLLQLLLHFRKQGLSRDLAKAALFGDRDVDDVSHSIRNIIYNLRKRLKALGLPDSQYVVKKKGVYFWCDDIKVIEDASEFETAFDNAMNCEDNEQKIEMLTNACYMYAGRFLAGNESSVWSAQEAERYREIFSDCVIELTDMLRDAHKYKQLLDVSTYASKVDPFSEWEIQTLEALGRLGKFDKTESFYRKTVDMYVKEYGGRANSYVREFINRIGLKLVVGHESLEEIQSKISNPEDYPREGYYCSLPVFQEIYRMTERMMERSGEKIFLMLCTILDSKGNPMREGSRLEELSERLRQTIIESVRHTDTVTRYGKGQYLVLLINTTEEDCSVVSKRISSRFIREGQRTSLSYSVSNIIVSNR
ncbi:MAG: hypothetical protein IKG25_01515 [Mogibacterium sp.]|nr:hypothetical protein [Mogibacterium sp.]MBR4089973.1 hypothetical protein [Mogibacterium sp.]